ncbi:hypothetical protein N7510_009628 [Penicillium lagena]|uniref:uncharacterized protein n=1 Tax=Penicillium lagena TaxID=94218 RepID=UPI002541CC16|nr:uncharacterized protein N7510_009628 [Penicillium lagena]KAJ5604474.1 hypothetical protein N7510_009628 [Penicillium lagena]
MGPASDETDNGNAEEDNAAQKLGIGNPPKIQPTKVTEDQHAKEKADDNVHKQARISTPRTVMLQPRGSEGYRGMDLVRALEPSLFERDNRMTCEGGFGIMW